MNSHVAVISLYADDVEKAVNFYQNIVGFYLVSPGGVDGDNRPHFRLGATYLALLKGTPQPALTEKPVRFPILAVAVDDIDGAVARLRANQVELPWGIEANSQARWVMFYDPAGNLIELVQSARGVI